MSNRHQTIPFNLAKTELLAVSANPSFHHNFTFQLGSSTITPSKTARNLGVVIDDKLNFTDHITKTAGPVDLHYIILRKSGPFSVNCIIILQLLAFLVKLTLFFFSIFYILIFLIEIPSYVYCVRLTRTCNITCMLLLFCWF